MTVSEREYYDPATTNYWLPIDEIEQDRLDEIHFALKDLYDGNVLTKTHCLLRKGMKILDVGCGPATWLLDMAMSFQKCEFTGVDLSKDMFPNIKPNNVELVIADVLQGLPFEDGTFDFVHMRLLCRAFKKDEWETVFRELLRVTKPGGYIESLESDIRGETKLSKIFIDLSEQHDQNPRIAIHIGEILTKLGANIIQTDERSVNLGNNDILAAKFLSMIKHSIESLIPFIRPYLDLKEGDDPSSAIQELLDELKASEQKSVFIAYLAQKPE
ncbi:S-adenosyl-L-methionine-dependent methyltransferase [Radiomyces spectabilis]|uniref:S-adenosyl-L-methionine-dependent methyltransferase n=1 Tax=Radiomyces spectabilis TaxID=64574 RepID=UPI0022202C56|nr:S-adenosyl-L-methionine-dependent methyltransferase [Radiomyces spectabilis]KAI8393831.1 S-adenosyl-L-methionine-dependent methyltransferase [Radiomyces spectabilis]